jgi:hypothetical protein
MARGSQTYAAATQGMALLALFLYFLAVPDPLLVIVPYPPQFSPYLKHIFF